MFLQDKVKDIDRRFEKLTDLSTIIVWGAGAHTAKIFEETSLLSHGITGIVDMNREKWGKLYFGFRVENPENIVWADVDAVIICAFDKDSEIIDQLTVNFGYGGEIITLYEEHECTPFYHLYDARKPTVHPLGDYDSWEEALEDCEGYGAEEIMRKAIAASKKVIAGEASWERDSCLFYESQFSYPLCAAILRCAIQKVDREGVKILDIGGALGSTYYQNRMYLLNIENLEYVIAEQNNFADYGHENMENETLKFIRSEDSWDKYGPFDIVLMSGSLQHISNYHEIITKTKEVNPQYIILDRTTIGNRKRICRLIPEGIYKSSYPVTFFEEEELLEFFEPDYEVIEKDAAVVGGEIYFIDGKAEYRYYVFQRKQMSCNS